MAEPYESCTHDCSTCGESCAQRDPKSFQEKPHPQSSVKKVIAVMSGKGGVGKSMVSSIMASELRKQGLNVGILDADITGPSIPKAFGLTPGVMGRNNAILPKTSRGGVKVMSINLLMDNETDPVVWRGPVIAGTVKQFWTDVIWEDIDVLLVDMPPGTGDVPLTVFQSLPIDGVVVVTSPQDLVSLIVTKAVNMANMMNIPLLGVVENMSYFECPDCGKRYEIFGKSKIDTIAEEQGLTVLAKVPINPEIAEKVDLGLVEDVEGNFLQGAVDAVKALLKK